MPGQLDIEGVAGLAGDLLRRHRAAGPACRSTVSLAFSASGGGSSAGTCACNLSAGDRRRCRRATAVAAGLVFESAVIARLSGAAVTHLASPRAPRRASASKMFGIGAAAAEMPADRRLHVVERAVGIPLDQRGAAHHHAGVQNPHCIASCSMKARWTGCSCRRRASPSIVVIVPAAGVERERHAARGDLAVEPDRAGRAGAAIAADLRAGQPEWSRSTSASVMPGSATTVTLVH